MKKVLSISFALIMLVCSVASAETVFAASKPASTSITSVSGGSKSFTVKWKKAKSVSGYQIQYSTSSSFKSAKKKTAKKDLTSKKITGLKAGKKYYVRVRTYKVKDDKKVYSDWSKKKAVTTKKSSSGSSSKKKSSKKSVGTKVYITPTGKRYHADPDCGGKNSYKVSLSDAKSYGLTPCKKCAGG